MTEDTRNWWPSRSMQRAGHLLLATVMAVLLYSPLGSVAGRDAILQVIVFPLLAVSGVLLWKGHAVRRWLRQSRLTGAGFPQSLFVLLCVVFLLGFGHHVDHVIRGNHVGWPVIAEVNTFTVSLLVYPFVGVGLYLGWRNRAGIRYWTALFVVLAALVITQHFGPTASEPPGDVIGPYDSELLGFTAFAWLLAFTGVVVVAAVYGGLLWYRRRTDRSAARGVNPGK